MTDKLKPCAWVCYSNGKLVDSTIDEGMAMSWESFGNTMVFPVYRHLSAQQVNAIRAEGLRELANDQIFNGCMWSVGEILIAEADRLENAGDE